ncbi:MAG TPA: hypothetical protein RMH85_01795 [Polyangiaceae bacterium LLY-WYZ-15_(1-7)]|nr:hypothetical protein [Polyangiaceae bacterium LLY-WYZ-15_(1-7)]HJL07197.1 hypothetical protein [Polyangiaceae bacterium LLY-WYZ-15_(1-7)]HJL35252.1 hypothetical protein [Polyangiaceae bacterium LLY-WYZ-15_(1-7)]
MGEPGGGRGAGERGAGEGGSGGREERRAGLHTGAPRGRGRARRWVLGGLGVIALLGALAAIAYPRWRDARAKRWAARDTKAAWAAYLACLLGEPPWEEAGLGAQLGARTGDDDWPARCDRRRERLSAEAHHAKRLHLAWGDELAQLLAHDRPGGIPNSLARIVRLGREQGWPARRAPGVTVPAVSSETPLLEPPRPWGRGRGRAHRFVATERALYLQWGGRIHAIADGRIRERSEQSWRAAGAHFSLVPPPPGAVRGVLLGDARRGWPLVSAAGSLWYLPDEGEPQRVAQGWRVHASRRDGVEVELVAARVRTPRQLVHIRGELGDEGLRFLERAPLEGAVRAGFLGESLAWSDAERRVRLRGEDGRDRLVEGPLWEPRVCQPPGGAPPLLAWWDESWRLWRDGHAIDTGLDWGGELVGFECAGPTVRLVVLQDEMGRPARVREARCGVGGGTVGGAEGCVQVEARLEVLHRRVSVAPLGDVVAFVQHDPSGLRVRVAPVEELAEAESELVFRRRWRSGAGFEPRLGGVMVQSWEGELYVLAAELGPVWGLRRDREGRWSALRRAR